MLTIKHSMCNKNVIVFGDLYLYTHIYFESVEKIKVITVLFTEIVTWCQVQDRDVSHLCKASRTSRTN